jgi:hypothetical protein
MSNTLALVLPGNRREVVKTTPTMTLAAVLAEACARPPKPLGDPACYQLVNGKAVLDLSTPLRFAGLAPAARLEVVRKPGTTLATLAAAQPAAPAPPQPPAGASGGSAQGAAAVPMALAAHPAAAQLPQATDEAMEGTSDCGEAGAPGSGGDAGAGGAAPDSAEAAAAAATAAAAAAAADGVAARLGRRVRVFSRDALLRAGVHPATDLPDSFYECAARGTRTASPASPLRTHAPPFLEP